MSRLPRLALGTIQPGVDRWPTAWALMAALEHHGFRVQSFLSRACFVPYDGATAITGHAARHLDSWMMSPETCRELFVRGSRSCDLSLVDGCFESALTADEKTGGSLEALCEWLDLPRLAVVDVAHLSPCQLPKRPESLAGLVLDRVADSADFFRWQTLFESFWRVPVVGYLNESSQLRQAIHRIPSIVRPPGELCRALGRQFAFTARMDLIESLALQRGFPYQVPADKSSPEADGPIVAVAFDDAFHCYFFDTLDLLELNGAKVCDFSPLRDDRLPPGTDIVYLGCGRPELHAEALAENSCLALALRDHVLSGGRVYAESGGLAYLCEQLETPDGQFFPMVGALPAVAHLRRKSPNPRAVEVTLAADNWLAPAGSTVRGYLSSRWTLEPTGRMNFYVHQKGQPLDLVGYNQAIGSRVHLNFAAHPHFLESFFDQEEISVGRAILLHSRSL